MASAMTTWTAVASSVAEQGRKLASAAGAVAWKLTRSTGKAAWILGTSLVVVALPFYFVADREALLMEQENAQRYHDAMLGVRTA